MAGVPAPTPGLMRGSFYFSRAFRSLYSPAHLFPIFCAGLNQPRLRASDILLCIWRFGFAGEVRRIFLSCAAPGFTFALLLSIYREARGFGFAGEVRRIFLTCDAPGFIFDRPFGRRWYDQSLSFSGFLR